MKPCENVNISVQYKTFFFNVSPVEIHCFFGSSTKLAHLMETEKMCLADNMCGHKELGHIALCCINPMGFSQLVCCSQTLVKPLAPYCG